MGSTCPDDWGLMMSEVTFTPTVDYAFANDDLTSAAPSDMGEYNPYPNYQADVINAGKAEAESGGNLPYEINGTSGAEQVLEDGYDKPGVFDQLKDLFKGASGESAKTGKPVDQILKEYGLSDKVVSSLIQVGGGMLAGASQAKMAEKNRNATWQREDEVIAKTRALREANSKAGTVGKMTYKPTGLLEAMKK